MGRRKELERDLIAALQQRDRALEEVEALRRQVEALRRRPVQPPSMWDRVRKWVDDVVSAVGL